MSSLTKYAESVQIKAALTTGVLPFSPPPIPADAPELYRQFWQLWSEEKFFACHEALEVLWRETRGRQRWFYNGLIHCAVAVYQHRRGNVVGAARQLLRAQTKLQRFRPQYYGVDVDGLLAGVERTVQPSLDSLSQEQREQLPALRRSLEKRIEQDFTEQDFIEKTEEVQDC